MKKDNISNKLMEDMPGYLQSKIAEQNLKRVIEFAISVLPKDYVKSIMNEVYEKSLKKEQQRVLNKKVL